MGYLQTTTGVTTVSNGTVVSFTTPICAQLALQFTCTGSISVGIDISLDGINFTGSIGGSGGSGVTRVTSSGQSFGPIAAMRYNISSITGTASISIAAAPSGSQ